jgi:uncharacterized protein
MTNPTIFEARTVTSPLEFRETDSGLLVISGYAVVYESRSEVIGGRFVEQIAKGAADAALDGDIRALVNHDPSLLLGRTSSGTLHLFPDDHGVRYEVFVPDTSVGRDTSELLRRGDITGSSFVMRVAKGGDSWEKGRDGGPPLRTIRSIDAIRDVGPVTFPAYTASEAALLQARSLIEAEESASRQPERPRYGWLR